MKLLIVQICLLVVCLLHSSEALQCYECEGEWNGDCANGVVSAMKVIDCPDGPGNKVAMCLQDDIRTGGDRKFSRGCTKWSNPTFCTLIWQLAAQNSLALGVYSCNQCSEPKCNIQTTYTKQ